MRRALICRRRAFAEVYRQRGRFLVDSIASAAIAKKVDHPYRRQPPRAFWKRAVQDVHALDIGQWYHKKFSISGKKIGSGGSCFAQHIGHALRREGFDYVDVEPAPAFLPVARQFEYGFRTYSARYGNIYTSRQLLQLIQRATGRFSPNERAWERDDGFVDPFRPEIEPEPFGSAEEVEAFRRSHLKAVVSLFEQSDVFVFTFGLTETWASKIDGAVFPIAPGVAGGVFDPTKFEFLNLTYPDVVYDMEQFIEIVRDINPKMHFLLTVSPVPLVATAGAAQVIVATTYSKSVLRAAAGHLAEKFDFVDYFPSYEIIASTPMRGMFFNPDLRTVAAHGVDHVMKQFFSEHTPPAPKLPQRAGRHGVASVDREKIACEEELLAVFGKAAR
jgi:hypothetical protein